MKKSIFLTVLGMVIFLIISSAHANQMTYQDKWDNDYWVDTSGSTPVYWATLNFPDSASGTYTGGTFEYDNYYLNHLDFLKITTKGDGDNSNFNIDVFLSKNSNHADYVKIASIDVPDTVPFTLIYDILNNKLLLNNVDNGPLTNVNTAYFSGIDMFYVGYACHFWERETSVDVGVSVPPPGVPEPSTMLLLGSGLIGLAGYGRKKFFKK
jgi:hypothetical protein